MADPLPTGAVYDCNVFLQALIRERGPAVECLALFERGAVRLAVSAATLEEVRDVLARPKLRRKFPRLTDERVGALLKVLLERADLVSEVPEIFRYGRDPKDEPYINLALAAGVPYIVSRDNDLLDLMDESRAEGRDFRARFPALTVLDPPAFLHAAARPAPAEETYETDGGQGL